MVTNHPRSKASHDLRLTRGTPEDPSARVGEAYQEIRRIAAHFRRQYRNQTLQTTEVVHEAYIRLAKNGPKEYFNQAHFFASVGRTIHALLVDRARKRNAQKRGGDCVNVPLDEIDLASKPAPEYDEIQQALVSLNSHNPKLQQMFALRYLIGLSTSEIAAASGRAESTVRRDCAFARAWLRRELRRVSG